MVSARRVLFLNPPHVQPIARRYMCTYYSPMFILPPHDLIQLATCIREWNRKEVCVLDAITRRYDEHAAVQAIKTFDPDIIVAITGIETFGDDMACLDRIKARLPETIMVVFGFYPTAFPDEVLLHSRADIILRGEPEVSLSEYLSSLDAGTGIFTVAGLAGRHADGRVFSTDPSRIRDLDAMPAPDYSLVEIRHYAEHLLGGPCGAILSARGCPFSCSYCTTTYGRQVALRSSEAIVAEMKGLIAAGARIVRFLDDTFTYDKNRVIELCRQILAADICIPWTCLSRTDTIDAEMLFWMKRAGCVRILVGVESYSPKILSYLNKRIDPDAINACIAMIHQAGIETVGWLLVGVPVETEEDIEMTVRGVVASSLDLIALNIMTPYASTPFFEQVRNDIVFRLLPYECRFKDASIEKNALRYRRRLFCRFYLRPSVLWRQLYRFLRYPLVSIRLFIAFTQ